MAKNAFNLSEVLKDAPRGAWVAVWDDAVVAYGADMQQVLAAARGKGIQDPLIVKAAEASFLSF